MYEKKYKNFVWGTQQQIFRIKLSLKSRLVILKEDMLFRTRRKLKVNVQLRRIAEFQSYFNSFAGLKLLLIICLMH